MTWAWHLEPSDLASGEAIDKAYGRAVAANLIAASDAARLRFFAAVARAQRLARNACAFVASFVRGRTPWRYLTQADEIAGQALIPVVRVVRAIAMAAARVVRHARIRVAAMIAPAEKPAPEPPPEPSGRSVMTSLEDGYSVEKAAARTGLDATEALKQATEWASEHGRTGRLQQLLARLQRPARRA